MKKQPELFSTRFNHNDFMYECWYDRKAEMFEDEDGNEKEFDCDTVYARTEFAKSVLDWINEELKTDLKFSSMYFPREYNFESDAINLQFVESDALKLGVWVDSNDLHKQALLGKIKAYGNHSSGYIAFHTEKEIEDNLELFMGVMLEVFMELNNDDYESYYDRQCVYDRMYKEAE